jgi:hypothetical protein
MQTVAALAAKKPSPGDCGYSELCETALEALAQKPEMLCDQTFPEMQQVMGLLGARTTGGVAPEAEAFARICRQAVSALPFPSQASRFAVRSVIASQLREVFLEQNTPRLVLYTPGAEFKDIPEFRRLADACAASAGDEAAVLVSAAANTLWTGAEFADARRHVVEEAAAARAHDYQRQLFSAGNFPELVVADGYAVNALLPLAFSSRKLLCQRVSECYPQEWETLVAKAEKLDKPFYRRPLTLEKMIDEKRLGQALRQGFVDVVAGVFDAKPFAAFILGALNERLRDQSSSK